MYRCLAICHRPPRYLPSQFALQRGCIAFSSLLLLLSGWSSSPTASLRFAAEARSARQRQPTSQGGRSPRYGDNTPARTCSRRIFMKAVLSVILVFALAVSVVFPTPTCAEPRQVIQGTEIH